MKIISHRGNINGPNEIQENHPLHIKEIHKHYEVEIDLWVVKNELFLGHDNPCYKITTDFFNKNHWIHCKNLKAVEFMAKTKWHWFWHEQDKITITSKGFLWCYPKVYVNDGITVTPNYKKHLPLNIKGICTDFLLKYKE